MGRVIAARPTFFSRQARTAVRIAEMNWMQVEKYLQRDDRVVLPLGSTEQHAYLSLATDSILAERVALPAGTKPRTERTSDDPVQVRARVGEGSFGGYWERPDEDLMRVWHAGVQETRQVLAGLK